jgi:hypothetical protein
MDRLLLLSREHIDRIMTEYKPPEEDEATCHVQWHSFFNVFALAFVSSSKSLGKPRFGLVPQLH